MASIPKFPDATADGVPRGPWQIIRSQSQLLRRHSSHSVSEYGPERHHSEPSSSSRKRFTDPVGNVRNVHFQTDAAHPQERSSKPSHRNSTCWTGKLLLSIDGGGIRGFSSLVVLGELMKFIQEEERRKDQNSESSVDSPHLHSIPKSRLSSGYLPCHYFDFICGSSTGGLIAIMVGRLRMNVDDCLEEFANLGMLFEKLSYEDSPIPLSLRSKFIRTWPTPRFEKVFDEKFSRFVDRKSGSSVVSKQVKTFQSSPLRCKTIVLCVRLRKGRSSTHVFRSYNQDYDLTSPFDGPEKQRPEMGLQSNTEVSVWQVAKAITAKPTYFKPFKIGDVGYERVGYVDGSAWAKNPTLEVFHEAASFHEKGDTAVDFVVSIGTESTPIKPSRHIGRLSRQRALIESLSKSTSHVHQQMKSLLPDPEDRYWRFEVPGLSDKKHTDRKVLDSLRTHTLAYLRTLEERQRLAAIAEMLVKRRRERARTPAWESFALDIYYVCEEEDCKRRSFPNRQQLLRHWIEVHDYDVPDASTLAKVEDELDRSRKYD